jgi:glucose uptake protein GlcU
MAAVWRNKGRTFRLGFVLLWIAMAFGCVIGGLLAMVFIYGTGRGHSTQKWAMVALGAAAIVLIFVGVWLTSRTGKETRASPDPEKLKTFKQLIVLSSAGVVVVWLLVWAGTWRGTGRQVGVVVGLLGTIVLLLMFLAVRRLGRKLADSGRPGTSRH